MNKMLSTKEVDQLSSTSTVVMTKREKLLRWAKAIRETKVNIRLYSNLEHYNAEQLDAAVHNGTAFAIAAADPILSDAGYKSGSAGDAKTFFELSQSDLHTFSCDCGGAISNGDMAKRIESLAK